ncbi:hypothetical protein [Pedobacter arcticus]|uniref:hypothetical protein n=1 Tax=Pedobacter arcticus TaxID=752140 RepID=UPI000300B119|nr:hypothetical protein [Pedobacter arcticus]
MKTFITLLSATAFLFAACNQNQPKQTTEETTTENTKVATQCYLGLSGKDSVTMSINNIDGNVTGTLVFNFLEKDDSNGDIKGSFSGDTLFVNYVFNAEGTVSKSPLVFLKKGDDLQQGYGDIVTYLGKTYFKDHSAIKFDQGFLLKPVDCK